MTAQDTIRRMAEANPVPDAGQLHTDPADAERLFSSIERRRDEMIGTQTRPSPSPHPAPRSRPWYRRPAVVFLAAVAAVLFAAVPLVIFTGGGTDFIEAPVATAPAPEVTATVPVTAVPTTVPSEAQVTEPQFELERWQLVTPNLDLGAASAAAFTEVVATDFGFVAVSVTYGDGIWASPDGVGWTQVGDPADPVGLGVGVGFSGLAVNGDRIAAVIKDSYGVLGTGAVATSTDGENWTATVLPLPEGDPDPVSPLSIAAYGTDGFIVSGGAIWLSTDGEEYQLIHEAIADPDLIDTDFRASASDGQTVVLGTSVAELLVTHDGETWELIPQLVGVDSEGQGCSPSLENLAHGPAGFVAVGNCGQSGTAWTSPDGYVWSQIPYDDTAFGEPAWPHSIAATERGYVVGGHSGTDGEALSPTVWTSPDGVGWTRVVLEASVVEDSGVLGVAIYENNVVAVGWVDDEAAIWRSVLAG